MKPIARPWTFLRYLPLALVGGAAVVAWGVFESGAFRSIFGWFALLTLVPLLGLLGLLVSLIAAIRRRGVSRLAAATVLVSAFAVWPGAWSFGVGMIRFPWSLARAKPAATVRLPLDGPVRVLWGGDDLAHNYHASTPDQRWAYDLGVEPVLTGSSRLEDYGCYGKDVVAPADAEVWMVHDGEPEQVPGRLVPNYRAPLGNMVALKLASGTYLLIAHLHTGSVAVKAGAHVAEGDRLGRCGDTGNTSEPHVHVHHQKEDPRLYPVSFAEGLPLYFHDTDGDAMPVGGIAVRDGKAVPTGAVVRHVGGARAKLGAP
jgi:hypothetical protein